MALNLDSTFFASRAAIPFLKKGDHPTIINYTSNAGWNAGGPGAGIYGTSKAGVHAITRALAKDLAEYGIRVNAVSPGTIDTPFHAQIKSTKPEVFASWKNNIMLGSFRATTRGGECGFFLGQCRCFFYHSRNHPDWWWSSVRYLVKHIAKT